MAPSDNFDRSKYNIWGNGTDFDAWFITSLLS